MPDLTLTQAVETLNRRRHRRCDEWGVLAGGNVSQGPFMSRLSAFEAIAVAQAYLREEQGAARTELWSAVDADPAEVPLVILPSEVRAVVGPVAEWLAATVGIMERAEEGELPSRRLLYSSEDVQLTLGDARAFLAWWRGLGK